MKIQTATLALISLTFVGCGGSGVDTGTPTSLIIFTSNATTDGGLYRMLPDGTQVTKLSSDKPFLPQLSKDRTFIAYSVAGSAIKIINSNGGLIGTIPGINISSSNIRISPDGTKIAYTDGTVVHVRSVSNPSSDLFSKDGSCPNFSADSSKLVFEGYYDPAPGRAIVFTEADISTIASDGTGSVTRFTTTGITEQNPVFSPDGTKVAFYEIGAGTKLKVINSDGTNAQLLTNQDFQPFYDVIWSPNGSTIIAPALVGANTNLWLVNTDGSGTTPLTSSTGTQLYMGLSPDGTKVAYTSYVSPDTYVSTINLDGTGQANLTAAGLKGAYPAWR